MNHVSSASLKQQFKKMFICTLFVVLIVCFNNPQWEWKLYMSLNLYFVSFIWPWGRLLLATRGCGASKHLLSVSSGTLALLNEVVDWFLEDIWPDCAWYDHALEAEPKEAQEELSGTLKESRPKEDEEEEEADWAGGGRGSCRLSLETNGLPTVTGCLSWTSSSMLE